MSTRGPFDWFSAFARARYKLPADWRVFYWNCHDRPDFTEIHGGVCTEKFKSGKRKGRDNWNKATNVRTLSVLDSELDEFKVAWSKKTGFCSECTGTKEVFSGWSLDAGTTWKPCGECGGTGRNRGRQP